MQWPSSATSATIGCFVSMCQSACRPGDATVARAASQEVVGADEASIVSNVFSTPHKTSQKQEKGQHGLTCSR